jgi:hypothetical protein
VNHHSIRIPARAGCALGLLITLLVLAAGPVHAQSVAGSIVGTVTDASNAVVAGATVTLTNLGTNDTRTAQSDATGSYQFVNLLPGNYRVAVEQTGFKRFARQPITVEVQSVVRIDVPMQIGDAAQTIEVVAVTPLLQTQTATLGQVVEGRSVMEMPLNGRNVLNLIALVPGVVPQGQTSGNPATGNVNSWGNYQIGGGTANQSATYLDGGPVNVSYVNSTALVPTQEVIQEFRVATNNVSPEFGRFAGGIVNLSSKSGTNSFHGTAYEFLRNRALNAYPFFNKARVGSPIPKPVYTQNQFGVTLGGPVIRDRTFFFLSWEGFIVREGRSTNTTVPTAAMRQGNFTGLSQIYDPLSGVTGADGVYTRTPFSGNVIPANRLNQAAINLTGMLFPMPNVPGNVSNFQINYIRPTNYNQYNLRFDHKLGEKHQLFGRYTNWHKNGSTNAALQNMTATRNAFSTQQVVLGDNYMINSSTFADFRASLLRFVVQTYPLTCCNFDYSSIAPGWTKYQNQVTFAVIPHPNIVGMNNFNTIPIILDTDNSYSISGGLTRIAGRHTVKFGGETRRIEWYYAQTNTAGGTFTVDSGFTSGAPFAASSSSLSPSRSGFGFASWMLGYPASGSAQEPALSGGIMNYSGLYVTDTWRMNNKLTLNFGVRWEQPGSFSEKKDRLAVIDLNLPQEALSKAAGRTLKGGLALVNSPAYPQRTWQDLKWNLFSPRSGFAYSFNDSLVLRGGYGISFLPPVVSFSLGPYNSPLNNSITTMAATLDGGFTPNLGATLSNPFPAGIVPPQGRSQAYLDSLVGQGIGSPLPYQPTPYVQQWNLDIQKQFGQSLLIDLGYAGSRGVHLPLYSVNLNQIPNNYLSMGSDLLKQVPNPFFGVIPASAGVLGQKTVAQGYLLKPYPQYLYISAFSPNMGDSFYRALQVNVVKRFQAGGQIMLAYSRSRFEGSADVLSPWLEANRFGVGGAQGVQDNNNIRQGEFSISSFDVPHRLVISFVYDLPIGKGKHLLGDVKGVADKLLSGWGLNGITTFQSGFPLAFMNASPNTLVNNWGIGNAGPGTGAGVTRPNVVAGCGKSATGSKGDLLLRAFNTACFTAPGQFEFGNEPRVDPDLRAQGIANYDITLVKNTEISERFKLQFRAEAFNLFNRVQFSPPNTQFGAAQFGRITAQYNNPRLLQFGMRLSF